MSTEKTLEIILENTEVIIDSGMQDGLLKDIPIVGNIFKALSLGQSIKDRIQYAKLEKLITSLNESTESFKNSCRNKSLGTKEEIESISIKLLLTIDNITDIDKSEIIANFLLSYLDEKITAREFRRCLDITNSTFIDDINTYLNSYDGFYSSGYLILEELERNNMAALSSSALFTLSKEIKVDEQRRGLPESAIGTTRYEYSKIGSIYSKAYWHGRKIREQK